MTIAERLDRVCHSYPDDDVAAWVTRRGAKWQEPTPNNKAPLHSWREAPEKLPTPQGIPDLVNHAVGNWTVYSFFEKGKRRSRDLYVVQCLCKWYETRTAGEINNTKPEEACCQRCRAKRSIVYSTCSP